MATQYKEESLVSKYLLDPHGALVVHWIIFLNVLIFIIGLFWRVETPRGEIEMVQLWGAYSEWLCFEQGEIWRIITYQFLHASLGHIAFNMIALWFFGPVVEEKFGHFWFLSFYLICGIAAALFSSLLGYCGLFSGHWDYVPMVGASGSIYGVLAACTVLVPYGRVQLLFPPVNLSIRQFSLLVLAIACAVILFRWDNAGGEAGHLGGMIAGFLLTFIYVTVKNKGFRMVNKFSSGSERPRPVQSQNAPTEQEIDEVLDKISRVGIAGLSDRERDILQRASRR